MTEEQREDYLKNDSKFIDHIKKIDTEISSSEMSIFFGFCLKNMLEQTVLVDQQIELNAPLKPAIFTEPKNDLKDKTSLLSEESKSALTTDNSSSEDRNQF